MKKLAIILVLAAACRREEGMARSAEPSVQTDAAGRADIARVVSAPAVPRMIVRTADVRIVVADTSKTVDAVTKSVESAGGYVSGSQIWREGELLRAKLTVRVPADKLTSTLASIRAHAKRVENETISSEDVSQEFVDLESQVRNLEATETELLELLKVARVNSKKATDVLEVHNQLTVIRGQIEQARGRMRYLSQVTSMSSIALDIVPDAIAQPLVQPGWRPLVVAKDASRALVALLQNLATAAIWFVIYVAPILGMLALGIAALVKVARRSRATEA
ncbi:MAG: DUF4349 domain-containing protein [Thermoanaerobaculia bacterium]